MMAFLFPLWRLYNFIFLFQFLNLAWSHSIQVVSGLGGESFDLTPWKQVNSASGLKLATHESTIYVCPRNGWGCSPHWSLVSLRLWIWPTTCLTLIRAISNGGFPFKLLSLLTFQWGLMLLDLSLFWFHSLAAAEVYLLFLKPDLVNLRCLIVSEL